MTNGVDPTLFVSGSFSFPKHSNLPLSNLTSAYSPLTSVDFTVADNGSFLRSFVDPAYFMYQDGIGVDGRYYVDVAVNAYLPALDPFWDQLGLTVVDGKIGGDFSTITFVRGFSSNGGVPVTVTETSSVSEPSTLLLFASSLALLGFLGLRGTRIIPPRAGTRLETL